MFYEQLERLCKSKGTTPTAFVKAFGLGSSNVTRWKNGTMPNSDIVLQFSDYFNVTTDYLLRGVESKTLSPNEIPFLQMDSAAQITNYKNKVLHLKDDSIFTRFREARHAAHVSLEDAAAGSFLSVEDVMFLEDDNIPIREIDNRMKRLREIGLEQISYLAYKYNVDLYWLLCGKVRPPAAVVQDGKLAYPPYEFMIDDVTQKPETNSCDSNWINHDHEPRPISFAADGWADITPENEEKFVKKLQEFEKRAEEMKKGR